MKRRGLIDGIDSKLAKARERFNDDATDAPRIKLSLR